MKPIFAVIVIFFFFLNAFAQGQSLTSPDGKIEVKISSEDSLQLSISYSGQDMVEEIAPRLVFDNLKTFGKNNSVKKVETKDVDEKIEATVPTKEAVIRDHYNQLNLLFKDFDFIIRAYDNGVAYRFVSKLKNKEVEVMNEGLDFVLSQNYTCYFPEEKSLISHNENFYEKMKVAEIEKGTMGAVPMLFTDGNGMSVSVTEADVYDYPNLLLKKKDGNAFEITFSKVVLKTQEMKPDQDRLEAVEEAAPYIAKTKGNRKFPWRVFMISANDKEIITNNLVYQLASPLKLDDTSWIQPGKVAWDWYNANNIYGVDFKSGLNTETYKYYIDFAAEFGLQYIILDEGWSKSTLDVSAANPDMNMQELTAYAKEKKIGIILWSLWRPMDEKMDSLLDKYEKWGIKGIKIDFVQRSDQYVTNYYERLAKNAASRHLLVDYHGAYKPTGMRRGYPNIINSESVKGLENNKWSDSITPAHELTIPFTRMTAGPMDFTPGGFDNAHKENFMARFDRPMALGTRAHQMALYVAYEAPLQMLADSPSIYYDNKECTEMLSKIPTIWDKTEVLEAKIGEYLVIARKSGNTWYLAGLTDGSARDFDIDLSFLDQSATYHMDYIEDGINSDRIAIDYKAGTAELTSGGQLKMTMNKGGGWIGILTKE